LFWIYVWSPGVQGLFRRWKTMKKFQTSKKYENWKNMKISFQKTEFQGEFRARHENNRKKIKKIGKNYKITRTTCDLFFPQHIVEGLLNSRRRVSDLPSWILISKTPARKSTDIVIFFWYPKKELRAVKRKSLLKCLILCCTAS